jgi:hypothetical protein
LIDLFPSVEVALKVMGRARPLDPRRGTCYSILIPDADVRSCWILCWKLNPFGALISMLPLFPIHDDVWLLCAIEF